MAAALCTQGASVHPRSTPGWAVCCRASHSTCPAAAAAATTCCSSSRKPVPCWAASTGRGKPHSCGASPLHDPPLKSALSQRSACADSLDCKRLGSDVHHLCALMRAQAQPPCSCTHAFRRHVQRWGVPPRPLFTSFLAAPVLAVSPSHLWPACTTACWQQPQQPGSASACASRCTQWACSTAAACSGHAWRCSAAWHGGGSWQQRCR